MTDEAVLNWPWGSGYYMLNGFTFAAMLCLVGIAVAFLLTRSR